MKACPFCGFDEGWPQRSITNDDKYVIRCKVCGAIGPESNTENGAERKWNGYIKNDININDKGALDLAIEENVGAPMTTLTNVPGVGNAQPPTQQYMGSCDRWDNKITKKKGKKTETFYPSIEEENINPYDKLGTAMAKKMKVPITFKKGKNSTVKQKKIG